MLDEAICHAAVEARDRRFDGRFFTGVKSTGIYCRCICPARMPLKKNRSFYASAAAAEEAGFRPCLICRPELAPGFAPIDAPARLAAQALARIEAGALEEQGLESLAADLGITSRHLRRVMLAEFGASPIAIAQTSRLLAAKRLLAETSLSVTNIAFAAGFRSLRRFNAAVKERYSMAPSRLRGRRALKNDGAVILQLSARGAYAPGPVFSFLAARALGGVEQADGNSYARTLQIGDAIGWIEVTPSARGLALKASDSLTAKLRPLIAAVRGAFDLDSDIAMIDAQLEQDARLGADVGAEPGVRVAGGLDGFEIAVRAVLGQQITVVAALKLTAKLCAGFGAEIEGAPHGLNRVFPSSARLAEAGPSAIAALGMPRSRAETLHRLACAHAKGDLILARGAIAAGRAGLAEIAGIGPWTVEYVALRGLGDPDAYPASDAALIAALGARGQDLDEVRPWRAYAAMRLWRRQAKLKSNGKNQERKRR
jgi:AraC family transcriptional regulator of adaptative response / DNA-3-methyladenine glycosylase II